jgi:hypothetical protein
MIRITSALSLYLLLAVSVSGIGPIPSGGGVSPDARWSSEEYLVRGFRDPYRAVVGEAIRDQFPYRPAWLSELIREFDFIDPGLFYPAASPMPPRMTVVFRLRDVVTSERGDHYWLVSGQEVTDIAGYCRIQSLNGDNVPGPFEYVFAWQDQLEAKRARLSPLPPVQFPNKPQSGRSVRVEMVALLLFGGGVLGISVLQRN